MLILLMVLAQEFPPGLDGVTLQEITLAVQKLTGRRFVWTEEVGLKNKRIWFKADRKIDDPDEIFAIYQSFLQLHGLALVPDGVLLRIQIAQAKVPAGGPRFVTRVFTLEHVAPREAHAALINLVTFPQGMLAIESARALLVTDYEDNLRRLEGILEKMDRPKPELAIRRVDLERASAADVELMMNALYAQTAKIVADKRTNSIVIQAEASRIDAMERAARDFDGESGTYIVRPRHRRAADLAKVVAVWNAKLPLVVDDASNTLFVQTDPRTWRAVERMLGRMDVRRPQVLIQATVAEVRTSNQFDLNVELVRLANDRLAWSSSFGGHNPTADGVVPINTTGATLAILRRSIGIAALAKAVEGRAKISVLDEPEVVTADAAQAEIRVTNQVPVLQVTRDQNTTFTSFHRFETAETTLSISPHVSEAGYVQLEVTIRIEKFTRESSDPTVPPPKASREIRVKSVRVADGGTLVIGGIVTQDDSESVTGVPFFQDLPIFGPLFRRTVKTSEQRTLYIFLTPKILYDEAFGDHREVTRDRRDEVDRLRGTMLPMLQRNEPGPQSTFRFSRRIR